MLGFGFDLLEFLDVLTKWFRSVHQAENKTLEELSRLIREISLLSLLRIFNIFLMLLMAAVLCLDQMITQCVSGMWQWENLRQS